jgi:hypothetical protein
MWTCSFCTLINNDDSLTRCCACQKSKVNSTNADIEVALNPQYDFSRALHQALEASANEDPDHQLALRYARDSEQEQLESDRLICQILTEAVTLSRNVSIQETWECNRCSFHNSINRVECDMCYEVYRTSSDFTLARLLDDNPRYMDPFSSAEFSELLGEYQYNTTSPPRPHTGGSSGINYGLK